MAYNLLINGVYWGYSPLTNLLLTFWDIQVGFTPGIPVPPSKNARRFYPGVNPCTLENCSGVWTLKKTPFVQREIDIPNLHDFGVQHVIFPWCSYTFQKMAVKLVNPPSHQLMTSKNAGRWTSGVISGGFEVLFCMDEPARMSREVRINGDRICWL